MSKVFLMLRFFFSSFLVTLSFFFGACSTTGNVDFEHVERNGVDAVITSNEAKVTYVKEHGHIDRFCAYRESDVETVSSDGFMLGFGTTGTRESIGESSGASAVALGGRSPAVLMTRELMYRACELTMNLNTDEEKTIAVYKMFLDFIADMVKNEHDIGSQAKTATTKNTLIYASNSDDEETDDDEEDPYEDNDTDEETND
jgi:hypothetical protein